MNFYKFCGKIITYEKCPDGLMDKTADSGSADTGSIPVRDAKKERISNIITDNRSEVFLYIRSG